MTYRPSTLRTLRPGRDRTSLAAAALATLAASLTHPSSAHAQRVYGIDTSSAANGSAPSQTAWNNAFNDPDHGGAGYKFAFVRSSRGGTSDATRLDDAHFYLNISRATAAGMLAGSYHFSRPDVTTHTADDDANHYLERAGMYMKPGYLLPVFDLEDGNTENTTTQLTNWANLFIDTIFNAKGIYPIVYTSSSYNNDEVFASVAWHNSGTTPKTNPKTYQWLARYGGNIETGAPPAATNYPNPYGVWDPNFVSRTNSRDPAVDPWAFWQQQNTTFDPDFQFTVDYNAANGNIEFVKDFLVPALWTAAGPGDWGTTANWNSDNPGYVAGNVATGPAPRLPNNANLDWVKLQNPNNATVTISSGARTVRKFYTQQPLNITGGSLSVSYLPGSGGQFDVPSQFNDTVTLSPGAAYSAHTTVVDPVNGSFNINGGTVTFTEIQLASHATTPGKIVMTGNATFAQTGGTARSTIRSTGTLAQSGTVSLTGGGTSTFTVNNGTSALDLDVRAVVSGAGRLAKAGPGTMRLDAANTYSGGTTVSNGTLLVTNDNRLGTPASEDADNLILDGGTLRTGAQIDSVTLTSTGTNNNYASFPTLTITGAGPDNLPASANILAGIRTIQVTSGGSGYVNQSSTPSFNSAGTFVDIVGGGGTGATAFATVSGGVVTSITITNQGNGYTSMPTIHISSTAISGVAGSGATASVSGIALKSVALADGGFDYTNPTLTFTGGSPSGTGAAASATSTPNWSLNPNRGITLGPAGGTLYQTQNSTLSHAGPISGSGPLTKSGPGTLTLSGPLSHTGSTTVSAGTLNLTQSLTTSTSLTVANNAKATLSPHGLSPTKSLQFTTLNLNTTGTLDLNDNDLVLTDLTLAPTIRSYISTAYANGAWTGAGLTSSTAAADPQDLTTLGYLNTGIQILVTTAYFGDANLDGLIDFDDYTLTDRGFAMGGAFWWEGDYNYDGTVNSLDYALIDRSFAIQSGPLSPAFLAQRTAQFGPDYTAHLLTSIPEPSALLAACALPLLRRRRE